MNINSKRFLAFVVATLIFVGMVFFTDYTPIESATAVTMITSIYIGAETIRKS